MQKKKDMDFLKKEGINRPTLYVSAFKDDDF